MREIAQVIARFREAGLKITPQRTTICHLLQDDESHPSAEEIYRKALRVHPSISFTTVYKTLQTLRDLGEIQELNIDPERVHYDPETREHAHFFCKSCRSLMDLEMDSFDRDALANSFQESGDLEIHHMQVFTLGLCGTCRRPEPSQ